MNSQAFAGPVIGDGVDALFLFSNKLLGLLTPQLFTACTEIVLVVNPFVKLTFTIVSFTPGGLTCVIVVVPACADHR